MFLLDTDGDRGGLSPSSSSKKPRTRRRVAYVSPVLLPSAKTANANK